MHYFSVIDNRFYIYYITKKMFSQSQEFGFFPIAVMLFYTLELEFIRSNQPPLSFSLFDRDNKSI